MKADPDRCAAEIAENTAHSREKLAVENGVDLRGTHHSDYLDAVGGKLDEGTASNGQDVLLGKDIEDVEHIFVLFENQCVEGRFGVGTPKTPKHGLG